MEVQAESNLIKSLKNSKYYCLACGTTQNMSRRKYCSLQCRQQLRRTLNLRTGILKALYTKYATFYFNSHMIFLDILPFGSSEIFSFIFRRRDGFKPVDDFCQMNELLGNEWWAEKRRTNKRYRATHYLLEQASRSSASLETVKPFEAKNPTGVGKSITCLKISHHDLMSEDLPKIIKSAFRTQAREHHPDYGGDSDGFRKVKAAYEELMNWTENPRYARRRGFPDKWFYDGRRNYWIQPIGKAGSMVSRT